VQSGDTLTSIADRFYNDAGQWRAIYDANRDQLTSADSLRVGMTIRIPQLSR
jgi:nucleoid-associated protein YgaU